ncbi:hypothetical protein [Streptomyces sp. NBC_00647]|uniref:hypothetical protein n=1 Tax=Streptomyces sp. NBC_00647 TaxID=2975796 RepID=UPI003865CA0D
MRSHGVRELREPRRLGELRGLQDGPTGRRSGPGGEVLVLDARTTPGAFLGLAGTQERHHPGTRCTLGVGELPGEVRNVVQALPVHVYADRAGTALQERRDQRPLPVVLDRVDQDAHRLPLRPTAVLVVREAPAVEAAATTAANSSGSGLPGCTGPRVGTYGTGMTRSTTSQRKLRKLMAARYVQSSATV